MSKVRINKRKEYKEQLRLFITLSNNVRKKIRKHFKDYGDLAESLFDDIGEVPNEYYDDYYNDMLTILSASAREVIITMGNRLHRTRISKKSDEIDPVIIDYVGTQTAQNVRNITETTRRAIQAEISLGLETGLSNPQISKNIRKSTGFSPKRATLIARTETHQAMNYGNQKVAERLGLKKPIKEWASALDERARSWHVNMNGVQVGIDEPFKIMTPVAGGGVVEKELQYAGDANGGATNVINCRCFVLYYDADDITTGDITSQPDVIQGDSFTEQEELEFEGFGKTNPQELLWHEVSWDDSPIKYKNAVSKFRALDEMTTKRGAFANFVNDSLKINMGKEFVKDSDNIKFERSTSTWRHEYGHIIDYQAMDAFVKADSKLKKPRLSLSGKNYTSAYYAREVADDAEDILTKNKKATAKDMKKFIDSEVEDLSKRFRNAESMTKKEFWDEILQDGKLFTKKELESLIGKSSQLATSTYTARKLKSTDASNWLFFNAKRLRAFNKSGILITPKSRKLRSPEGAEISGMYNDIFYSLSYVRDGTMGSSSSLDHFADYFGAITNNKLGYGHSNSYYKKALPLTQSGSGANLVMITPKNTTEAFANFTALSSDKNHKIYKRKMKELAPKTTDAFEEVFDEINKLDN